MTIDYWVELNTLQDVAKAQADGWEIERQMIESDKWIPWAVVSWHSNVAYRGRPAKPKMKTVTSECWRYSDGELLWRDPREMFGSSGWQRFPAGDFVGEVEDV